MSTAEAAQFNALTNAIAQNRQRNYSAAAAIAFLVYEILSTFTMEVVHIWKQRWTVVKVLYIFSRYYGILYLGTILRIQTSTKPTVSLCRAYFYLRGPFGPVLFVMTLNVIFVLRLNALYNKNIKVLVGLVILLICEFVAKYVIIALHTVRMARAAAVALLEFSVPGCLDTALDKNIDLTAWIPALLVASILFSMTIYKCLQVMNESSEWQLSKLREISPLIMACVCDGTIFYFLTFAIMLSCTIVDLTFKSELQGVTLPWIVSIYSLSVSRLILNIRHTANRIHINSEMTESQSLPWLAPVPSSRLNFQPEENCNC